MRVEVKFNLNEINPSLVVLESDDLDAILLVLRGIFKMTGTLVVLETQGNMAWMQGGQNEIHFAKKPKKQKIPKDMIDTLPESKK